MSSVALHIPRDELQRQAMLAEMLWRIGLHGNKSTAVCYERQKLADYDESRSDVAS